MGLNKMKACDTCKTFTDTKKDNRDVFFGDRLGWFEGITVDACSVCDETLTIPHSSIENLLVISDKNI